MRQWNQGHDVGDERREKRERNRAEHDRERDGKRDGKETMRGARESTETGEEKTPFAQSLPNAFTLTDLSLVNKLHLRGSLSSLSSCLPLT